MNIADMERQRAVTISRIVELSDHIASEVDDSGKLFRADLMFPELLDLLTTAQLMLADLAESLLSVDFNAIEIHGRKDLQ